MALDKIKFQTNLPVELALKYTEGKLCDSQFGDPQFMFSTLDDRCFFVAEKVAKKIHGLRLQPGEPIDVCKAEVDYGNGRKGIEWQIARVNAPEGEEPSTPPPASPGKRAAQKFWKGSDVGEQPDGTFSVPAGAEASVSALAPVASAVKQPAASQANGISKTNGSNGKSNGNNGHTPLPVEPQQPLMPWALFLLSQTKQLIDVYALACQYASEKHAGLVRGEDVRSVMLSAFINVSKRGGADVA